MEFGIVGLAAYLILFRGLWLEMKTIGRQNSRLYSLLTLSGTSALIAILAISCVNLGMYPYRSLPGFLGFALSYFAIVTHHGWRAQERPPGAAPPPLPSRAP